MLFRSAQSRGTDKNSVYGDLFFVNPQSGDFRLKEGSVAFSAGFKNFAMDSFGVVSNQLKALSKKVPMPSVITPGKAGADEVIDFMGAKVKNLRTEGERSATGMDRIRGVLVVEIKAGAEASGFLQANDVILLFNNKPVNNLHDLSAARMSVIGTNTEVVVFRNQKEIKKGIELGNKK